MMKSGLFGECVDRREPVEKSELERMKIEAFNEILDKMNDYYDVYETSEGREYTFFSEGFGEWVEEHIVHFYSLKESEDK